MSQSRRTLNELSAEINRDLRDFARELMHNLQSTTPIRTGQARGGWQNIYTGRPIGSGGIIPLAKNDVDYIGVLDGQSPKGFTSRQAPKGIVREAVNKTRKK